MAFGTPVVGTTAYSAQNGTSVSPSYPIGVTDTDQLVLVIGQKPSTANSGTVTTPSGWTLREELTAAGGYGTTLGADAGNTNLRIYTKDTVTGSESGTLSVTVATNNVCWANITRVPTGGGAVTYGSADGQRTTTPTSPLSVALTNGASATAFQAGDFAIWAMCIPTDVTTPAQFSAHTITASGVTYNATAELIEPDSGTGTDIGGFVAYVTVATGSGGGAPTVGATLAGTLTNVRGPIALLRMREAAAISFDAESTSFALSGQAATLNRTYAFNAEATSFAVAGQDATLVYTPAAVNIDFDAEAGAFAVSGQDATLAVDRRLSADAGTYTISGQAATVVASRRLSADAGAYTLTGQAATLLTGTPFRELDAQPGSFALVGQAATLVGTRNLSAAAGSFVQVGQTTTLRVDRALAAQPGGLTTTGQDASLGVSQTNTLLDAQPGVFVTSGAAATLAVGRAVRADAGAFRDSPWADAAYVDSDYAAGASATLARGRVVGLSAGSVVITGAPASLLYAQPVALTQEQRRLLFEIYSLHGLASQLVVGPTSRTAGSLTQLVTEIGGSVTVSTTGASTEPVPDVGRMIEELAALHGLGETLTVTAVSRSAGAIAQTLSTAGGVTTVTRV